MIISLVEISVWASWSVSKYIGSSVWSVISYSIWGYSVSEEDKFKCLLMKRITDLEKSNEELTAAFIAFGDENDTIVSSSQPQKIKQTIRYINNKDDKKPPPPPSSIALALPTAPTTEIQFQLRKKKELLL